MTLLAFYDAPAPPPGLFDEFLAIPTTQNTISTTTFPDFIRSLIPYASSSGALRWVTRRVMQEATELTESSFSTFYSGVPVARYSSAIFDAFKNRTVVGPFLESDHCPRI